MAKSFTEASDQLVQEMLKLLSKQFLKGLADIAKPIIYKRVKAGYGVSEAGSKEKLKALADSTIQYRKQVFKSRWGAIGKIGPGEFFSPRKSNATLTGQMLNAISYRITDSGVTFFIDKKIRKEGGASNFEVAEFYSEARPFFGLTSDERQVIAREIENELRKLVLKIK